MILFKLVLKNCVAGVVEKPEGYVPSGFLGLGDSSTPYYPDTIHYLTWQRAELTANLTALAN
jgi:hypothetical protein